MLKKKEKYNVAVFGATGAVGTEMISTLEQRDFPIDELRAIASPRSEGRKIEFKDGEITVQAINEKSFEGIDIAIFSAGGDRSVEWAPVAVKSGAVVIDNSNAWRMDPDVPLIVPEVNPEAISGYTKKGIIANPNCSTIQMVVVLKPIHDRAKIKRVVVSTYQAVSGTGHNGIEELREQTASILNFKEYEPKVYPHQIAFNCLPHIDVFLDNAYTKEEMKMVRETAKILGDDSVKVSPTAVRVPVFNCHAESLNIETEEKLSPNEARAVLAEAPGITVFDAPQKDVYPLQSIANGKDDTYVGRIRQDETIENGINMWIVADNLRKGAALNAVQIAEKLIEIL
ncbi:MAG: aspartate-semialdehyde dehydrogenase [Thermodesulfovibrionales bacterium]|nr:aspartate-semialdehyde dehydrogenase [Thermodesulfovibrionales bacterium]